MRFSAPGLIENRFIFGERVPFLKIVMGKFLRFIFIFCFAVFPATLPSSAETIHHLGVRNFTDEGIEVEIRFFGGGDERFPLGRDECSERTLRFDGACGYEICAWGLSGGLFYGCREIDTCADAGIAFFVNRGPEVDAEWDCDYDFDDDDTHVAVWCFIRSAIEFDSAP